MQIKRLFKFLTLLLFVAQGSILFAQPDSTSTDSSVIIRGQRIDASQYTNPGVVGSEITIDCVAVEKKEDYWEYMPCKYMSREDTALTNFQFYHPLYREFVGFQHLGNIGSAYKNLYFTPQNSFGFNYGINTFNQYLYTGEQNYYRNWVDTPITKLWYAQGAENLIYLKAYHSQNFGDRLNVAVNYRRLTSDGLYFNQATDYHNTQLSTNYTSRNYKYFVYGSATFNRMENIENGGITSDSIFENLDGTGKLPGVLLNAQNNYKNNRYHLRQEYLLKPAYRIIKIDSARSDTVYDVGYFTNTPRLLHQLTYDVNKWTYSDDAHDSLFYNNFFRDTLSTYDSNSFRTLTNVFALTTEDGALGTHGLFSYTLYYKNQLIEVDELNGFSSNYVNNAIGIDLRKMIFGTNLEANFEQYFSGYNQDDGNLKLSAQKFMKQGSVTVLYQSQLSQPGYTQRFYSSNNYYFNNPDLEQQQTDRVRLIWITNNNPQKRYFISAETKTVNNYLYYDTAANVQQANQAININSFRVQKNFTFGRWHLDNDIVYQISDNDSIVRLPDFMSKHSLYYERQVFHKVLRIQAGVNLFYNSAFRGYAYSPALRQFHLQNEVEIGGYPLVDLFLVGKVKQFLFSLKMEHLNEGQSGDRYYASPHHPLNGRVFRLGIAWRFID